MNDKIFSILFDNKSSSSIGAVIVTMDRHKNLESSARACLNNPNINEIIILDYGSNQSVSDFLDKKILNKVKLYRIEAPYWHLSKAYNIAIQLCSCDIVVKLDADYEIKPNFFEFNYIKPNEYISGFNIKDSLCGFLMIYKKDFLHINGYNERIVSYGYDDDDINQRLQKTQLRFKPLNRSYIRHLDHDKNHNEWFKNSININLSRKESIKNNKNISINNPWTHNDRMSRYRTISGFVCCMNRKENLIKALTSWVDIPNFDEIIVLDYGSNEPISIDSIDSNKIKIYRENAKYWHLSRAYNIAAQLTTGDILLKLDSDYYLNKNFFKQNNFNFDSKSFYTGNRCRTQSLWGFLMLERKHFFEVNGYNERIVGWGHDDVDINERLKSIGLKPKTINIENIRHLHHSYSEKNFYTKEKLGIYKSREKNIKTIKELPWTTDDVMSKPDPSNIRKDI